MLSNDYIKNKVKALLNIDDTDLYDDRLEIMIGGSANKLLHEGVDNIYEEGSNAGFDYVICIAYQVALDLDLVTDYNRLYTQYATRVVTLRMAQANGH